MRLQMIGRPDPERHFAIAAAVVLPWLMLLVTDWTVTPVGMVDAWIYRALGRDLVHANASMGDYYYAARAFVLVPRYFLTRFLLEGVAHAAYGLICAHLLLLAVLDLLTSIAKPVTRLPGVLAFGTCLFLLRSLGWGYIDGSLITWFMIGLAGVARWYRPGGNRHAAALVAGGCFAAMLATHPMTLPLLVTPVGLMIWLQRRDRRPGWWRLWVDLVLGGLGALLLMGVLARLLYGRFFFFMPIVEASRAISTQAWKRPFEAWLPGANWLVLLFFTWLASALLLIIARLRRVELTPFERFAWLNAVGLMTLMGAIELFTNGYWLEYPWFASYFLPGALLAIAAIVGERREEPSTIIPAASLAAVFVFGAALAWHLEIPYFAPALPDPYFPARVPQLWLGVVPLIGLQLGLALLALVLVLVWRGEERSPSVLLLIILAFLIAGPINQIAPGDEAEAQSSASVARVIGLIQDELKGSRPAYWYDAANPLARLFVSISSGHLAYYSQLGAGYPKGSRALRPTLGNTTFFFEAGDPVVILDETTERFPRAQQSFSEIGIALTETRRVPLRIADRGYWLIFARLEPKRLVLRANELATNLKAAVATPQERSSDREKGFLSFGPYVHLAAGPHRVVFHLRLLDKADAEVIGSIDVVDLFGKAPRTFAGRPLIASAALSNGDLDAALEFTLKEPAQSAEFRTFTAGNSRLALRSVEIQRPELPTLTAPDLVSATLALGADEALKSADLRTSGLFARLAVESSEPGQLTVSAALTTRAGARDLIELSPGDELAASVGGVTRPMTARFSPGPRYEAAFENQAAAAVVKIALTRKADTSAPESSVALPAPLVFTFPGVGASLPRSEGVNVFWSGAVQGGSLRIRAEGTCINPVVSDVPLGSTSHTFPRFEASSGNEASSCDVAITLEHSLQGTVDPAWGKGGAFDATVSRSRTVRSTP